MLKGLFVLNESAYETIFCPPVLQAIEQHVEWVAPRQDAAGLDLKLLADVDVLFSGWGGPEMDEAFMAAAPNLKAVFYSAGSIKRVVTPAFWARNIPITSSAIANAVPVAEFTVSQIIYCLKGGWYYARQVRENGHYVPRLPFPGIYQSTVGLISLGMIGRYVVKLLKPFEKRVIAYDPFISDEEAAQLGVELVSLDEIFQQSDVVSLHTPWLKETENMITGAHFEMMRPRTAFINTARGAVVNEPEMIAVLQKRPDLFAVLDVTYPEPPEAGSPLYTLPNVVLTPHIAGAIDPGEHRLLGETMVAELERFINGEPLHYQVTQDKISVIA